MAHTGVLQQADVCVWSAQVMGILFIYLIMLFIYLLKAKGLEDHLHCIVVTYKYTIQ